ncbi:ATP-grasp fold amidoligase family protein [Blastococcus sp. VKM Ac-2987]|uniref:ATP-grasp fold amidoligase family protein n=1 Tax=Blastococcus sp. VKM Ac-2987 TaxID=3004141 RepID=UPI0022AB563B|nr:ATP-grasp fold amidoligase family protein [Blastococcus sp. VKM Ac-2987]MCZ2860214.1 ATP-grasp fold amidoligase family protein [Blastococcus sp. VKM Ac-2987]
MQPAHRRIAGLLPPTARRRYLYLAGHHRLPRLRDPRTFTEKVNWRILRDRRPELAWTCDKLAMKEYAARVQQEAGVAVPETLWSGEDLGAVAGRAFDRAWVLKPNHRSGLVRFGAAAQPMDAPTVAATRDWLGDDQSVLLGEWAYSQARQLFLVEEDIAGAGPLDDYKFFVFHGEVAAIQVDRGRFTRQHVRNYYSPEWEPITVQKTVPSGPPTVAPGNLAAMLHAAEVLGRSFDFMRVDLYSTGDTVWFGELTPYPGGGVTRFEPPEFDSWLGERWSLPTLSR